MPKQLPSHVGLFGKLKKRRDATNSAIDKMRGKSKPKPKAKPASKKKR
jgi:hypothetical protein